MTQKFVRYSPDVEEHLACDFGGGTPVPLSKPAATHCARHRDDQGRREYFVMPSLSALRWNRKFRGTTIEQKEH